MRLAQFVLAAIACSGAAASSPLPLPRALGAARTKQWAAKTALLNRGGALEEDALPAKSDSPPLAVRDSVPPAVADAPQLVVASTTPPSAATKTDHTSSASAALANLKERAGPAVLMLAAATGLVKAFGENGVIALVLVLQAAMYHESCSVVHSFHAEAEGASTGSESFLEKVEQLWERWWWFATAVTCTSLKNLVERCAHLGNEAMDLVGYGMAVVGLLSAVVGMATHADAGPDQFRGYLGEVAASHFALIFLVGQSSFWIKTVHDFGLIWVLFPALLVIVNDTMAYAFGIMIGKHKLLPRLSPKKTVEGFVGAAFSTMAVAAPLLNSMLKQSNEASKGAVVGGSVTAHALTVAAFVSLISPFGGFLASAVKRAHGAKDFGSLIPGHGGVVDRFDCQVVTAPFVYLYLKYMGSK